MNTPGSDEKCYTPKIPHGNDDLKSEHSKKSNKSIPFKFPEESQQEIRFKSIEKSLTALEERYNLIVKILEKHLVDKN